jgi:hypothetical protein
MPLPVLSSKAVCFALHVGEQVRAMPEPKSKEPPGHRSRDPLMVREEQRVVDHGAGLVQAP